MDELETGDQNQAPERMSSQELAAQMFGQNYHGAPAEESNQQPATEELQGVVEPEQAEGETETPEVQPDEEIQEAEEPEYVSSFSEFVEAEGIEPEFMENLTVSVKVNGEVKEIPFSEVRAHAQMSLASEGALEQAKAVKKAAQEAERTRQQQFDTTLQVVSSIAQRSLGAVQAEQKALEESGLRDTDPAEYSARKLSLQEKMDSEKAEILRVARAVQEETARRQQQSAQEQQEQLAQGAEKLREAIPAWSDPEVARRDVEAVTSYVTQSGLFTEQQVRENTIPGLWVLAHKARLYDESQGKADATKKRLRRVPKVAKPGAPKSPEQINAGNSAQARQQIRQGKTTTDQIAAAVRAKQLSRR